MPCPVAPSAPAQNRAAVNSLLPSGDREAQTPGRWGAVKGRFAWPARHRNSLREETACVQDITKEQRAQAGKRERARQAHLAGGGHPARGQSVDGGVQLERPGSEREAGGFCAFKF